MARRKPTDIVQLRLRLPDGLRRLIETEAKQRKTSLNKELVRRLQKSFDAEQLETTIQRAAMNAAELTIGRLGMGKTSVPGTEKEDEQ
jgi:hypothetical protein